MFDALKSLFDNPQREAKRLNRDAAVIIDSAIKSFAVDRVRETALATLEHLEQAHVRAEALGTLCGPALDAIDEFTGHWAHAAEQRQPSGVE